MSSQPSVRRRLTLEGSAVGPAPGILKLSRHLVTLRLTGPAHFHFYHGGALMGLMCAALRTHPLPERLVPFVCESGAVDFEPGEPYRLGFTVIGQDGGLTGKLLNGLERLGREVPAAGSPPALAGNFTLEEHVALPQPDIPGKAKELAPCPRFSIRFLAPLRVRRPASLRTRHEAYLNDSCFPLDHFLTRLWARVFRVAAGREPSLADAAAGCPPVSELAHATPRAMLWLDAPGGRPSRHHPGGMTLGGVVGRVDVEALPAEWLPMLVACQHIHVGENTHFGFGRYRVMPAAGGTSSRVSPFAPGCDLPGPGRTLMDRVRDRVAAERPPGECRGGLPPNTEFEEPRCTSIVAAVLRPTIDALLDDCRFAIRRVTSSSVGGRDLAKALASGGSNALAEDLTREMVRDLPADLGGVLESLFPSEPLNAVLTKWVTGRGVRDVACGQGPAGNDGDSSLAFELCRLMLVYPRWVRRWGREWRPGRAEAWGV